MKRTIQMAKSSVRLFVKVRLFIGCVDQVKRNYNCPGMAPPISAVYDSWLVWRNYIAVTTQNVAAVAEQYNNNT